MQNLILRVPAQMPILLPAAEKIQEARLKSERGRRLGSRDSKALAVERSFLAPCGRSLDDHTPS